MQLSMENRKEIILGIIHSYSISLRTAVPGLSDRECYHRLADACRLTGNGLLEKRDDYRYIIGNLNVGGELKRFFTLYRNPRTGKLDCDLTHSIEIENFEEEDFFMILFKIMITSSSMVLSDAIPGNNPGKGPLSVAARSRAELKS